MKRLGLGIAATVLVSLSACGGEDSFTAKGAVELTNSDGFNTAYDNSCAGIGGFDDIRTGTDVVIYDADGKKIGLGELDSGTWKPSEPCRFAFEVTDIPDSGDIYSIEVSHRGQVSFKKGDAEKIALTLG